MELTCRCPWSDIEKEAGTREGRGLTLSIYGRNILHQVLKLGWVLLFHWVFAQKVCALKRNGIEQSRGYGGRRADHDHLLEICIGGPVLRRRLAHVLGQSVAQHRSGHGGQNKTHMVTP